MTDATQHLFDWLLTRAPDGQYVPHLATWTVAPDGLTWTFKLKPSVKFHSGDPLTSAARRTVMASRGVARVASMAACSSAAYHRGARGIG